MKNPQNILIVRTDRIGDVVLTLPMAKFIKQKYPDCKVSFLVREYTKVIPESCKYVDETLVLPHSKTRLDFTELYSLIKIRNFDTVLFVYPRFSIALAAFLSRIKTRIGSGYRLFSFLFNKKIYEHRKTGEKHELEYNLNLLQPIGITNVDKQSVSFDIQVSEKSEQKINEILKSLNILTEKKIIIIHPGSGGSSIDWPISKFIDLSNRLARELAYSVLITGSETEKPTCEKLTNGENTYNLAGKLELSELIALIDKSEILIANSTGPIHLAAALNKKIIGFYPKIKECSVDRWGPYTDKRTIFSPTIDCKFCTRKKCEELNCMDSINVDDVFLEIMEKMDRKSNENVD